MRLKFESKLNQLHSLYRDIETRYERALEDIDQFEEKNKMLIKLTDRQRGELSELVKTNSNLTNEIEFNKSQIKLYLREGEVKQRRINEMEVRINELNIQLEKALGQMNEGRSTIGQMNIEIESNKTIISGLKHERSLLETSLRDNHVQRDKYYQMYEEQKANFEKTRDELQALQREEMAFDKLNKNFEDRMKELYDKNNSLQKRVFELEKETETLKQTNAIVDSRNESLNKVNQDVSAEIQEINALKNEFKKQLEEATETIAQLKVQINDKNNDIKKTRKDLERLDRRLAEMEQANDNLEIEKNAHERTTIAQKKQLNDHLKTLSDSLTAEKDAREKWIERYEREHRKHGEIALQYSDAQAKIQQLEILKEEHETSIRKLEQYAEKYKVKGGSLQRNLNETERKLEEMTRAYKSSQALLGTIESDYQKRDNELNNRILNLTNEMNELKNDKENLASETQELNTKITEHETSIKTLTHILEKAKEENESLDSINKTLHTQIEEKSSDLSNAVYEKQLLEQELVIVNELSENQQMETEEYFTKLAILFDEKEQLLEMNAQLEHMKKKLMNMNNKHERERKAFESQTIQTDSK